MGRITLLLAAMLAGCSHSTPPSPEEAAAEPTSGKVEDAAIAVATQLKTCEKGAVLAQSITFEDLLTITDAPMDKATYDREVNAVLDALCKKMSAPALRIYSAQAVGVEHVPASGKLKKAIDYAAVKITVDEGGTVHPGPKLVFVNAGAGWKFSPKK